MVNVSDLLTRLDNSRSLATRKHLSARVEAWDRAEFRPTM